MKERSAVSQKLIDGNLPYGVPVGIGIDQSLTGFALSAVHTLNPVEHITWVYKSPYFGVERLADIRQWLNDHLEYLEEQGSIIQDIAMEGTVLASHAALVLGELSATVRLTIFDFFDNDDDRRFPLKVPPMTLKKYASGKGNSKKQEMLLQIYKRWGMEFNDDNAADAYGLARIAAESHIDAIEAAVIEQMKDAKYRDQPRI
jgi:Holliday junction resolvasome RuvABC endonuclease subunit